ncbi:MAG: anti-sigma factor antagonist [Calditrichaeota bacterium]|nr:MAG: anti-sigma factor antagonist [Calditrichota bacterium]
MLIDQDGVKIDTRFLDKDGQIMQVELSGYIDQANVHHLQKTIDHSLKSHCYKLIFNFQNLVYMSSAGWGVIIGEIKRFREKGGDIKLANMGPELYEIYQMLEFYHILNEYTTVEEALQSFYMAEQPPEPRPNPVKKEKQTVEEKSPDHKQVVPTSSEEIHPERFSEPQEVTEEEIHINLDEMSIETVARTSEEKEKTNYIEFNPLQLETPVDFKLRPLPDKIKAIIAQYPHLGPWKIKRMLRHPDFGNERVSYFTVRRWLKKLDLDTKEKRYRYYRSC